MARNTRSTLFMIALLALLLALPLVVAADIVSVNSISATVVGVGENVTVSYSLVATNPSNVPPGPPNDHPNCNATNGQTVTVNFVLSANVSASPTSLAFNSCGTAQSVNFSATSPGYYCVTTQTSGGPTHSSYQEAQVCFTVEAAPPPPPPPCDAPAAPAIAAEHLRSLGIRPRTAQYDNIISQVAHEMASGAFGRNPCAEGYRDAVLSFLQTILP